MRIRCLLLAVLSGAGLCLTGPALAKGMIWSYTMSGVAYDAASKEPLRNTVLVIGRDTATTDADGHYSVEISGVTCDRGGWLSIRRCNERAYGKLAVHRLAGVDAVTIKSRWHTYAFCDDEAQPDCQVYHRDLVVK